MYGWRGRVGMLAPSRGDTLLYEFYRVAPEGVMAVPYSCELTRLERNQLEGVRQKYEEGVRKLDRERVDVISVGGTPPQILNGWDECRRLIQGLRESANAKLVACAESEVNAVKAVGAKRIVLITPHGDELNDRLRGVFEQEGITVVSVAGSGLSDTVDIAMVSAHEVYRRVVTAADEAGPGAIDGVHISCPRWPTIELLAPLEETLGVPVTSGGQAQIWSSFEALRVRPRPGAWGSLFDRGHASPGRG